MNKKLGLMVSAAVLAMTAQGVMAASANPGCAGTTYSALKAAADAVVDANNNGGTALSGFGLPMWVTVVNTLGQVCLVVNTAVDGKDGSQASNNGWLASRVISAQKANTANSLSINGLGIGTGNLYAAVQPGASLFGLQESNPVDAARAYKNIGNGKKLGQANDPLLGGFVGGVNVFGGGLALYDSSNNKVGAIGVSGDTSCTDHAVAWRIRAELGLDGGTRNDFEKLNLTDTFAALGDHPHCANDASLDNDAASGFK